MEQLPEEFSSIIIQYLQSKGIDNLQQLEELLEPSYFAIIPVDILEKKTISSSAKLLYAEIMALSRKSGKCFATNKYLAERLGLSETRITELLTELKEDFLVKVEIKRNSEGTHRDIKLTQIGICTGSALTEPRVPEQQNLGPVRSSTHNRYNTNRNKQNNNAINIALQKTSFSGAVTKIKTTSYGREDINQVISYLKEKLNGTLDGSSDQNRKFAKLLIDKFKKDFPEKDPIKQIKVLIEAGFQNEFHQKNMTNFRYLYNHTQNIIQSIKSKINNPRVITL